MNVKFTRRDLLKGLAAVPLVPALNPFEQAFAKTRKPTTDLWLWFHGLFAFVIKRDYIAVLTPKVEQHQYLAGPWKQEKKLIDGEWYRLSGVSDAAHPNPMPALTQEQIPILSNIKAINMADSYCLIRLPFPKQIIPLRYVKADFSGVDAPQQEPSRRFPTVQLMRYRVIDYPNLRLDPFKAWTNQKRPPANINYHIFGEPNVLVHPEHAVGAFDEMIQMFSGVDLKLLNSSDACFPLDLNLPPGIDPKQQVSLAERNGECPQKQGGGRTGNCFMVIIDAREPTP